MSKSPLKRQRNFFTHPATFSHFCIIDKEIVVILPRRMNRVYHQNKER